MRVAAQVISFVFHPLLLTSYLTVLLCVFFPPLLMVAPGKIWLMAGFIFAVTFALPAINLVIFRYFGNISSLTMRERKERVMPFFFIAIMYTMVTVLFYYKLPVSSNLVRLLMIISALIIIAAIATLFYKVSIHSLAMWGGIGILLPLNKMVVTGELLYPTAGVIVITGVVMSSRLILNAHVPREILIGSCIGFVVGLGGMFILF